jgi:5-methylcytosine-specific restriction endonuclease McrA
MYSRERQEALKRDGRKCTCCGEGFHVEVHHIEKARIDLLVAYVRRYLLHPHTALITLCRDCHAAEHKGER